MVRDDALALHHVAGRFQEEFYAVLFELDPSLRPLFPPSMDQQRRQLFAEIQTLVDFVVDIGDRPSERRFATHARDLGRFHDVAGVTAPMYEPVGRALIAALRESLDHVDDRHAAAWEKAYALMASAMQDPSAD